MTANHGDFVMLHRTMLSQFAKWQDEISLREWGWRISELHMIEGQIARLITCTTLTPEGEKTRDKLLELYNEVWRPRRVLLDDGVSG